MKKQVLIAAVAATMTSVAMADISITGNAKFEYTNTDNGSSSINKANTEANLSIKGKSGDTTAVVNVELNSDSNSTVSTADAVNVEDMYVTTKLGDVNVKAGNFASGTTALLGEIDNGGRAHNKVSLSTKVGPATIGYHVSSEAGSSSSAGAGATQQNSDTAAVTISMPVAGFKVQVKEQTDSYTGFGISGDVAGFGVRLEQKNSDSANSDVTFGQITKDVNGMKLGYAWIDADAANKVDEDDSSIFAREMGAGSDETYTTGVNQFSVQTTAAGNTITLKAGTVEEASTDNDFTQIDVKRALASGATLAVTYTDYELVNAATSTETFEVDLSVKF